MTFAPSTPHEPTGGASATGDAPGRVNLMGDHTDYNLGFVLPMPIPQRTYVSITPRQDRQVTLQSDRLPDAPGYRIGEERRTGSWSDYVQGITGTLHARGLLEQGFDLAAASDVPVGAGLSSSAALAVATLRGLRAAFGLALDDLEVAKLAQHAEVSFVGAPVGIMDPLVCSLGVAGSALFVDTRDLSFQEVQLPRGLELVVIASGITHAHGTGDYRVRRGECEEAARTLGVTSLRELQEAPAKDLTKLSHTLQKRVAHVLRENGRVLETVRALAADDREGLRALFAASHASLRDDFEVSLPELDLLVELAANDARFVGARLTGGGFGGSVVMLAEHGEGAAAARALCATYVARTGRTPQLLVPAA